MKILLFTDNHWSTYSSIIRTRGIGFSTRLENQIKTMNWIEDLAVERGCESIICLGDFLDKPDCNSEEISALKEVKWSGLKHYFIVGNHEMGSADLKYNSTNILSRVGTVVDKPLLISDFNSEVYLVPYVLEENRKPLKEYLKSTWQGDWGDNQVRNTVILSHNDISGIQYGPCISKIGFDVNEIENSCDLYINGHLHNQQYVTSKILNLGNCTGQNFSEDGFKYSHSVAILDTEELTVDLIDNPYAFYFYKIEGSTLEEVENQIEKTQNAFVTVKVPEGIVENCKNLLLNNKNVLGSRIIIVPDLEKEINSSEVTGEIKSSHVDKFKDFIVQQLGTSDILLEELSFLE